MGCNCAPHPPNAPVPQPKKEESPITDKLCPQCMSPLGKTVKGELVILWCSNGVCDYRVIS